MSSTFSGFNIARSGLFVSQRALNVTSHNIANANTPGFSRQVLDMKASRPEFLAASNGALGTGVDSESVKQIRDEFLDFKYRGQLSIQGEWGFKEDIMSSLETVFNEPSDSGISSFIDQFFQSIQELNKNPESLTTRSLVRQRAIALAKNINQMQSSMEKLQSDVDFQLQTVAKDVNGYAQQIAELNKIIYISELDGSKANDIRDQRNNILDKLSELVSIDYYEDDKGRFSVLVNGQALVSHYEYDQIKLTPRIAKNNDEDALKLNDISWASGGTFKTIGGKIKGILDMRDGISGAEKGIPYYMDKLTQFADVFVNELNRIHMQGFDLNGEQGAMLFTKNGMSTADYENEIRLGGLDGGAAIDVTAEVMNGVLPTMTEEEKTNMMLTNMDNIITNNPSFANKSIKYLSDGSFVVADRISAKELSISSDVANDLDKIAASELQEGTPGDGNNALKMINMRSNTYLYTWGSPDDYVKSLVANLGVDAAEAIRINDNQAALTDQVDYKRQSIMGVSLDEEMSNMVMFQHSYNASARMITTIDEMLDKIINGMGTVGR